MGSLSWAGVRICSSVGWGDAAFYATTWWSSGDFWLISGAGTPVTGDTSSFTSHKGLFRFLRLPFGLVNAPVSFQRALDISLSGLRC